MFKVKDWKSVQWCPIFFCALWAYLNPSLWPLVLIIWFGLSFSAVLVNETPVLPYLQAVGDLDEIELLPEGTNVRESSSNGMLSTGLPNTDTCDNPYLRPAKRLRRTLKTSWLELKPASAGICNTMNTKRVLVCTQAEKPDVHLALLIDWLIYCTFISLLD